MIITYYGASCFKAQAGDTVLAFDPPSKKFPFSDFGFKTPRFQTDIVLISHSQHNEHNGYDMLSGKSEGSIPLIVDGPGEYEIGGVYVTGIKSFHDSESGEKYGLNTIYKVLIDNISICHLGDFGEKKLTPAMKELIGEVDILFVPIDGVSIDYQDAAKISAQIGPKIVVPMHYHKDKNVLKKFLKEMGGDEVKPIDKISIKKKDLNELKMEVMVLDTV